MFEYKNQYVKEKNKRLVLVLKIVLNNNLLNGLFIRIVVSELLKIFEYEYLNLIFCFGIQFLLTELKYKILSSSLFEVLDSIVLFLYDLQELLIE